jgi:H+/Cl- antiporter ClcA
VLAKTSSKTSTTLTHWRELRLRIFSEGMLVGLFSGVVVVAYRFLFENAEKLRKLIYTFITLDNIELGLLWILALILISYFLSIIVKIEPLAGGSGIPQVKGVLLNQLHENWASVILWKFIGGITAIFTGLSLGSGGPSVQLGACVGQGVSRTLGRLKVEEKYLITSGASAGLAAIFNAPLAGAIFALEEMHRNFSPIALTSAMAASITADFVSQHFFGQQPIFKFAVLPVLPLSYYFHLICLGIFIGVLGLLFNLSLIKSVDFFKGLTIRDFFKPLIPIIIAFFLGICLPHALGAGHHLIDLLQTGYFTLSMLVILLIVKFTFTMLSYGSGVPGGIFLPLLVIGALAGTVYGKIMIDNFSIAPEYMDNFIVLSMAALFTAVFKAPITGSVLITEMTGSFSHLYAMITVSLVAYIITDLVNSKSIYEELMKRIVKSQNSKINTWDERSKVVLEIPVCLGSELDTKKVKDVKWPPYCLLVGIKRGDEEIIPKGDSIILAGDCLVILTNEDQEHKIQALVSRMSNEIAY